MTLNRTQAAFALLLLSFFVQFTVFQTADSSLNLYHILVIILSITFLSFKTKISPSKELFFFSSMLIFSALAITQYGANLRATIIIFALGGWFLGLRFAQRLDETERNRLYRFLFFAVVVAIVARNMAFFNYLSEIYSRSRAQGTYVFISSGGRNIEATLLGLISILMIGTRQYFPAVGLSFLSSTLMLSRAGLIVCVISIAFQLYHSGAGRRSVVSLLSISIVAGFVVLSVGDFSNYEIVSRFDIGRDVSLALEEGQGRLALWKAALAAISTEPFGVGIGNGLRAIEDQLGLVFRENNVHNIYLQTALEGGILSGIALFVVYLKHVGLAIRRSSVEAYFVVAAFTVGFVEFTGYEAFIWFFVGVASVIGVQQKKLRYEKTKHYHHHLERSVDPN